MRSISQFLGLCLIVLLFSGCSSDDVNEKISAPFIGDVILKSQADVDEFVNNNYSGVDGMLLVTSPGSGEPSNITDISGLSSLSYVSGDLNISSNVLTTLNGLQNITEIGGLFILSYNDSLKEVNALSSLRKIGDILQIGNNPQLINIDGFSNLNIVRGSIIIFSNHSLTSIGDAFENLESALNISISQSMFESIDGFNSLTSCYSIELYNNEQLESISGFNTLHSCKRLSIGLNGNLQSIDGFSSLNNVDQFMLIQPNTISAPAISITAFSNLTTIENNLFIRGLAITDIDFISNVETVGNDLNIDYNENLSDFCGLNTLIFNNGLVGNFYLNNNLYNPTKEDILNGNCSQ